MEKILKISAIVLFFAGSFFSCNYRIDNGHNKNQDGVIPSSIEHVIDVFELKYGEVKEYAYQGLMFQFSIADIVDSLLCYTSETGYIPPDVFNNFRMHAFLNLKTGENGGVSLLKVSSQRCRIIGEFQNDGFDVQRVWDELEVYESDSRWDFKDVFFNSFGKGTKTPHFSIYMAKVYPIADKVKYAVEINDAFYKNIAGKVEKSMYKFIFIITN